MGGLLGLGPPKLAVFISHSDTADLIAGVYHGLSCLASVGGASPKSLASLEGACCPNVSPASTLPVNGSIERLPSLSAASESTDGDCWS